MKLKLILLMVLVGVGLGGSRVYAHHSLSATYHADKVITLNGKIVEFLFRNPHSFLQIEAPDEKGVMQRWSLEWRSSGQLGQQGIKRSTLKIGDEVVVTMNPSRTPGDHRGALKSLHRKSDGFGWGDKPGDTID
ncbi:MAG TPA: DUF6152 family protein [Bryobacteraceae bacterium]|nr:DUF6152 family protein [Bryobacteraceae bacterium]